jgi:hypothetical protein
MFAEAVGGKQSKDFNELISSSYHVLISKNTANLASNSMLPRQSSDVIDGRSSNGLQRTKSLASIGSYKRGDRSNALLSN